jgi:hypothetical protein
VNKYYSKNGSTSPAITRSILELNMVEEYHWLPQDIKKIPYRDLQIYSIIRKQRTETVHAQSEIKNIKNQSKTKNISSSGGQSKRYKYTKL